MGLSGMTGFSHSGDICQWVAVDESGTIVGMDLGHWDKGVYLVDEDWNFTYWDLLRYMIIGDYEGMSTDGWSVGSKIGNYNKGNGYYNSALGYYVSHGTIVRNDAEILTRYFYAQPSLVKDALNDLSKNALSEFINSMAWDNFLKTDKLAQTVLQKRRDIGRKLIKRVPEIIAFGSIIYDMYKNGININNCSDAVISALSSYLADVAIKDGLSGLVAVCGTEGFGLASALAISGVFAYGWAYIMTPFVTSFNHTFGSYDTIKDIYWEGYK